MTNLTLDREAWLTEAAGFLLDDVVMPAVHRFRGDVETPPFRVSVGFPTGRLSKRQVAACYRRALSADGHNEIFVSPTTDDSIRVLDALAHELIHAADDCQHGHRNLFAWTARAIGLEGPLTATHAGPELTETLQGYVELLGPIPHAAIDVSQRPKSGTRMRKCQCRACGFTFRTTARWLTQITQTDCMVCDASDAIALDV